MEKGDITCYIPHFLGNELGSATIYLAKCEALIKKEPETHTCDRFYLRY